MKFVAEICMKVAQDFDVVAASEDEAARVAAEKLECGEIWLDREAKTTSSELRVDKAVAKVFDEKWESGNEFSLV